MSQQDKSKQSIYKIHKQKVLKSKNNKDNREVSANSPNNQKFSKTTGRERNQNPPSTKSC